MKQRQIYYRRKDDKIILEGKQDGKSIFIWTLPDPEELLNGIMSKASFFSQEKQDKIMEKVKRLDIKEDKPIKSSPKVRVIDITRTPEKDAMQEEKVHEPTKEELRQLWEMTK